MFLCLFLLLLFIIIFLRSSCCKRDQNPVFRLFEIMLLALTRRYVCRRRTSNHGLYPLLSQFSSSPSSMTRTTSAQGQAGTTIISPPSLFSDTISPPSLFSNTDWWRPKMDPDLNSLFFSVGRCIDYFEIHDDDDDLDDDDAFPFCYDGIHNPTEAVDASFMDMDCHGFQPSESFMLKALSTYYGDDTDERSLKSYLALFEWAGEKQSSCFLHMPKTFDALNKILADSNPILFKDLSNVLDFGHHYRACFYNTLFVGYLIARLPRLASFNLDLLLDEGLNTLASYNKLVNVLLQHKLFAEADAVLDSLYCHGQISLEPNNNSINREYLRGLARSSDPFEARFLAGHALITLVGNHCESKRFKDAAELIDEFKELCSFNSDYPYVVWVTSAYRYAESSCFAADPKVPDQLQACNPDHTAGYTTSLTRHVMEKRLEAASQLLMDMKELRYFKPTVHREFTMYHFLLNLLCGGDGYESVVEAEINCCKEGNFDRLIQVLRLHFRFRPGGTHCVPGAFREFLYNKLIAALCRAGRVEDAYLLFGEFNLTHRKAYDGDGFVLDEVMTTFDDTYYHMINEFRKINREDVAARLLLQMLKPFPETTKFSKLLGLLSS